MKWHILNETHQTIQCLYCPEKVDERRKAMGLGTLEETTNAMYSKYKVEKPAVE